MTTQSKMNITSTKILRLLIIRSAARRLKYGFLLRLKSKNRNKLNHGYELRAFLFEQCVSKDNSCPILLLQISYFTYLLTGIALQWRLSVRFVCFAFDCLPQYNIPCKYYRFSRMAIQPRICRAS